MDSALAWKRYYAAERTRLGRDAMRRLVDEAVPPVTGRPRAIVVPHTRLEITGGQIAAAVATVLATGAEHVLALGVLHGGRRRDHTSVARARDGDTAAITELRGVHTDDTLAAEEFSLDAFRELLDVASRGRVHVVSRYPFLVGDDPSTLPGLDELQRLVDDGALLVATTDPIHHGHAYGTPEDACLPAEDPTTVATARLMIDEQLTALVEHRFDDFARLAAAHRSDFRDTGPVLAQLLGSGFEPEVHELALVDYAEALGARSPSWVAGALITC